MWEWDLHERAADDVELDERCWVDWLWVETV